jgi:BON domain
MGVSLRGTVTESLAEQISLVVQSRTGGRIKALAVDVNNGAVSISGRTTTYYLKQLATHAALDFAGCFRSLKNDITVG